MDGSIKETAPIKGAQKSILDIALNLTNSRGDSLETLPKPDAAMQKSITSIFPNLDESYSLSVLEITEGKPMRLAQLQPKRGYQPGSVGKLAVICGLFAELQSLYPDSFEKRQELLKTTMIRAGRWAIPNEHTVPIFDPKTRKFEKRILKESDVFSLYEWADHMLSVSSNGAASVVWREAVLMRAFGEDYPVSEEVATEYFKTTPKSKLTEIGMAVVNDPLRAAGITEDEWRLGSLFTSEAKKLLPGSGGSTATTQGMLKFMVALERGKLVDTASSLEIKRLMYMTDRRIRYAGAAVLKDAAVYFKSGSLYGCTPEEGYICEKYKGNKQNYMNSVAIVEHPDGTTYLVALMSNVLKKNSSSDHYGLASQIDRIVWK